MGPDPGSRRGGAKPASPPARRSPNRAPTTRHGLDATLLNRNAVRSPPRGIWSKRCVEAAAEVAAEPRLRGRALPRRGDPRSGLRSREPAAPSLRRGRDGGTSREFLFELRKHAVSAPKPGGRRLRENGGVVRTAGVRSLVRRDDQLAILEDALLEARRGESGFVGGEAGIGKTRLASELSARGTPARGRRPHRQLQAAPSFRCRICPSSRRSPTTLLNSVDIDEDGSAERASALGGSARMASPVRRRSCVGGWSRSPMDLVTQAHQSRCRASASDLHALGVQEGDRVDRRTLGTVVGTVGNCRCGPGGGGVPDSAISWPVLWSLANLHGEAC